MVEISSLRGGRRPTWQSKYGSPRFAREDGWIGGSLMAGHTLLRMTLTSNSLSGLEPSENVDTNKFIRLHPADSEFPPIQGFFYPQSSKAGLYPVR